MSAIAAYGRPTPASSSATAPGGLHLEHHHHGSRRGTAVYATAGIVLAVLFLAPLVWAVLRSFEPESIITGAPGAEDFTHLTIANYRGLFVGSEHLLPYIENSLIVAAGTAVLTALLSTLAGYGLEKFAFRGKAVIFSVILVAFMIPYQAIMTPAFLELNYLHLTNSLLGLVFFYSTFNLPFGTFVMRNTFAQIPSELEDSAAVDGATVLTTLTRVFRPLVLPGAATVVLYAFLFAWTEFLGALTFLTDTSLYTLPVALLNVELGSFGTVNYGFLIGGAVVSMIPCIVLYVALQRFYVEGLTSGAVKG